VTGVKTNERPGTRAVVRHSRVSAYKAREVLNLIRGQDYEHATEILEFCDRGVAEVIGKLLHSAAANARHNDGIDPEETFVSACYADEGTTLKRWRPRARGRATRIRKRTCHITIILSRLPEDQLTRRRARVAAEQSERRARRVAGGRLRSRAASRGTRTGTDAGAEEKGAVAEDEDVTSEALAALDEARALETTSHHQELEAEAGAAIEHEFDEDGGDDEDGAEDVTAVDLGGETSADSDDSTATAPADDAGEVAANEIDDETDGSPSGDVVDDEPEVSPASASGDGAESTQPDEEN
jgi:large subunit ribosomal protein L22